MGMEHTALEVADKPHPSVAGSRDARYSDASAKAHLFLPRLDFWGQVMAHSSKILLRRGNMALSSKRFITR